MNVATNEQDYLQTAGSAMLQGHEGTGTRDGLAIRLAFSASPSAKARVARAVGAGIKSAIVRVSKAARNSAPSETIAASQTRSGVVATALRQARAELVEVERASATALSAGQLDEAGMVHVDRRTVLLGRIEALRGEADRLAHETRQAEKSARGAIGRLVVEAVAEVERELVGEIARLEQRILSMVAEDLERLMEAHALADNLKNSGRKLIESEATSAVLPRVVNM